MDTIDMLVRMLDAERLEHRDTKDDLNMARSQLDRFTMMKPEYKCDHKVLANVCNKAHKNKIEAIKSFRAVSGAGLKEAKEAIEGAS